MASKHEVHFEWPHPEPAEVIVSGSFNNWARTCRLAKGPDGFKGAVQVPWDSKVAYKYIVDGVWAVHPDQPTEPDHEGNINNIYISPPSPDPVSSSNGNGKLAPIAAPTTITTIGTFPQLVADFADTVAARDGTSSALNYVASGLGAALHSVVGVDPINAEQIAIPTPLPTAATAATEFDVPGSAVLEDIPLSPAPATKNLDTTPQLSIPDNTTVLKEPEVVTAPETAGEPSPAVPVSIFPVSVSNTGSIPAVETVSDSAEEKNFLGDKVEGKEEEQTDKLADVAIGGNGHISNTTKEEQTNKSIGVAAAAEVNGNASNKAEEEDQTDKSTDNAVGVNGHASNKAEDENVAAAEDLEPSAQVEDPPVTELLTEKPETSSVPLDASGAVVTDAPPPVDARPLPVAADPITSEESSTEPNKLKEMPETTTPGPTSRIEGEAPVDNSPAPEEKTRVQEPLAEVEATPTKEEPEIEPAFVTVPELSSATDTAHESEVAEKVSEPESEAKADPEVTSENVESVPVQSTSAVVQDQQVTEKASEPVLEPQPVASEFASEGEPINDVPESEPGPAPPQDFVAPIPETQVDSTPQVPPATESEPVQAPTNEVIESASSPALVPDLETTPFQASEPVPTVAQSSPPPPVSEPVPSTVTKSNGHTADVVTPVSAPAPKSAAPAKEVFPSSSSPSASPSKTGTVSSRKKRTSIFGKIKHLFESDKEKGKK